MRHFTFERTLSMPARCLGALLGLAVLFGSGCGAKPSQGGSVHPRANQAHPDPDELTAIPPAATPEAAIENLMAAKNFDQLETAVLARQPRERLKEWLTWVERCAVADAELDLKLREQFGEDPDAIVPAWAQVVFKPGGRYLKPFSYGFNVLESMPKSDGEAELLVSPSSTGQPSYRFTAVKEEGAWKVIPSSDFDPTATLDEVKRYVQAKDALIAADATQFKNRKEVVKALTRAMQRGAAVSGTPEEAIERYEAARLAGDVDGMVENVTAKSRTQISKKLAQYRRLHDGWLNFRLAAEAAFGPQPNWNVAREPYDPTNCLGKGIEKLDVLGKRGQTDREAELVVRQTYQGGYVSAVKEVPIKVLLEEGRWKVELRDDDIVLSLPESHGRLQRPERPFRSTRACGTLT